MENQQKKHSLSLVMIMMIGIVYDPSVILDDDGEHEHFEMTWNPTLTSTQRGSAEEAGIRSKEFERRKNEAIDDVLCKYPNADISKITATKDEFGRTFVFLTSKKNAAIFPLLDDGRIGKSQNGGNPGKILLEALGSKAEEILERNADLITALEEAEKIALERNNEYEKAVKYTADLQLRLESAIKENTDILVNKAKIEKHYRNVIKRNTQLQTDLINSGENQRAELARQLARGRAEMEQVTRERC